MEKRLQEQILEVMAEMAIIQAYICKENKLGGVENANNDWFTHRHILRILLSIQISYWVERDIILDYICDGIKHGVTM